MDKFRAIQGLKYPDEYIIKFFFKLGLDKKPGRVVEFGCGNGNNLMLFHHYDWDVTGIDISQSALADAEHNFRLLDVSERWSFHARDVTEGVAHLLNEKYDVVLFPSVLYYMRKPHAAQLLKQVHPFAADGALVFCRSRTPKDYRYARGTSEDSETFHLTISETGEEGALMAFYSEYQLVDLFRNEMALDTTTLQLFQLDQQNPQCGRLVSNSDIVLWGRVGSCFGGAPCV